MTRNDTQFTKWPLVAHIVATTEDGLIGIGNKLPWGFVKEDMKFFKSKTLHHVVLMGWNTVQSLPVRLKNRFVIGLSSPSRDLTTRDALDDLKYFHHIADNLMLTVDGFIKDVEIPDGYNCNLIYIAGGGKIYNQTLLETDVVFRNVIKRPLEKFIGDKVYYPLAELEQHFCCISTSEVKIEGGIMVKEIWVKPR